MNQCYCGGHYRCEDCRHDVCFCTCERDGAPQTTATAGTREPIPSPHGRLAREAGTHPMTNNAHHELALKHKDDAWYDETGWSSDLAKAKLEATLALAYEQRTANLIALYSMDDGARQGMVDGAGVHSGNWVDVTKQIKERLGLA